MADINCNITHHFEDDWVLQIPVPLSLTSRNPSRLLRTYRALLVHDVHAEAAMTRHTGPLI